MSEIIELYNEELKTIETSKVDEKNAMHTKFKALGGTALFMGLGAAANMDIANVNTVYGTLLSTVGAVGAILVVGGSQYLQDIAVHQREMAKIEAKELYETMTPAEKQKVDDTAAYQEKVAPLKEETKDMITTLRAKFTEVVENIKKPTLK